MHAKTTTIIFVLLLAVLTALNLLTADRVFSENENRYLTQRPARSLSSVAEGTFMEEFDEYVIDQFAFRDAWVGVKTVTERVLGHMSSSGVYFAQDGYLMEMFGTLDERQLERNLGFVREFAQRMQDELGVRVDTMLVPTATAVLSDKLPAFAPEIDQRALLEQAAAALPSFVDVTDALSAHADEYIFYRTDHHWTTLGAYYAYADWRAKSGETPRAPDDYDRETLSNVFFGTTYSKANLYTAEPDTIEAFYPSGSGDVTVDYNLGETVTDTIYERSYLERKDKYSVFFNANQPVVRVRTGVENGRRLLLVKDSYANAFAQLLLADYEEVILLDLRYFKEPVVDFAEKNGVTDALVLYNLKGFSADVNIFFLTR